MYFLSRKRGLIDLVIDLVNVIRAVSWENIPYVVGWQANQELNFKGYMTLFQFHSREVAMSVSNCS